MNDEMSEEDEFEIIQPGTNDHSLIDNNIKKAKEDGSTLRYNKIADVYNGANEDAYIKLKGNYRLSNLERVLSNRGLERDLDYTMNRPDRDEFGAKLPLEIRPVILLKITTSLMRKV